MRNLLFILCVLGGVAYADSSKIEVLSVNKPVYTGGESDPLSHSCHTWKLTAKNIVSILALSENISEPDLHQQFYQLPCEISGKLVLDGGVFDFTVNAASFIALETEHKIKFKGCKKEKCKPFFLMSPEK